jgi:hypothetical protein
LCRKSQIFWNNFFNKFVFQAGTSNSNPVTGQSQWPGWLRDHACVNLFHACMNNVKVQCICSFVDLREHEDERTWFLEELKMMTILVLRSFYYSGLSLWVSSFASISLVLFPCLWFRRSKDSNDGGWLLLGFSCFCSSVPLLPSLYAAQFSFMSPSVSFYSPSLSRLSPCVYPLFCSPLFPLCFYNFIIKPPEKL